MRRDREVTVAGVDPALRVAALEAGLEPSFRSVARSQAGASTSGLGRLPLNRYAWMATNIAQRLRWSHELEVSGTGQGRFLARSAIAVSAGPEPRRVVAMASLSPGRAAVVHGLGVEDIAGRKLTRKPAGRARGAWKLPRTFSSLK